MNPRDDDPQALHRSGGGIDWDHYERKARALRAQALTDFARRLASVLRELSRRSICVYRVARHGCTATPGHG